MLLISLGNKNPKVEFDSWLQPYDGNFKCIKCGKSNYIDMEEKYDYIIERRLRYVDYKPTNEIYIFNQKAKAIEDEKYTLDQTVIYSDKDEIEMIRSIDNPSKLLNYGEKFVHCLILDDLDDKDFVFQYVPYVIYRYVIKANKYSK